MTPPMLAIWAPADPAPVIVLRGIDTGCADVCTLADSEARGLK